MKKNKEMSVVKKTFIIVFTMLIVFVITLGIKSIVYSIFHPLITLDGSYSVVDSIVIYKFQHALTDGLSSFLTSFAGLVACLSFVLMKIKFSKKSTYMVVLVLSELLFILSFINNIFYVGMPEMRPYEGLFLDLSIFLIIGIFLMCAIILYLIICGNKFVINSKLKNIIPWLILMLGFILTCVGVYQIRNNLNVEYVKNYLETNHLNKED